MELLDNVEGFISSNVKVAKTFLTLVKLEARLAGLSVFPLVLNICMLFVILFTLWITIMGLLGLALFIYVESSVLSIFLILLINMILVFVLIKTLNRNLKKMSFEKTRESLKYKRRVEDEPTKAIDSAN